MCDYQQNPQAIIDAPRWYITPNSQICVETGFKPEVIAELKCRGHKILQSDDFKFGGAQAILKLENGYFAASDPRKDGQAVGY